MPYQRPSWRASLAASRAAARARKPLPDGVDGRGDDPEREEQPEATSGDQRPSTNGSSERRDDRDARAPSAGASTGPAASPCASARAGRCPSGTRAAPSAGRTPHRSTAGRRRSCPGPARRETADTACPAARSRIATISSMLLASSIDSRETGANPPPRPTAPARARVQRQRAADHDREKGQDEHAARRDRWRTHAPTSARRSAPGTCRAATARTRRSRAAPSSS